MTKYSVTLQPLQMSSSQTARFAVLTKSGDSVAHNVILHHGNIMVAADSAFIEKKRRREHQRTVDYTRILLERIFSSTAGINVSDLKIKLSNPIVDLRYREVCCWFPEELPLAIYPWLSTSKCENIPALPVVKQFVLANCMFGGSMRGIDEKGHYYPIIDHNLQVESVLVGIQVDEVLHPYEIMIFSVLPTLFRLMLNITKNAPSEVIYHLPVIDYMFYGVQLYLSGKLSRAALIVYIEKVKIRGKWHTEIIQRVAEECQVSVFIVSPFDNLFRPGEDITAENILNKFNILEEKASEAAFVDDLLNHLTQNTYYPQHQETWKKIVSSGRITFFSPLEELFRIANIAVIASAFIKSGSEDFEVCSILPIDEKPIGLSYNKTLSDVFGKIISLSWLPPLLSYCNSSEEISGDSKNKNNLFRFRSDVFKLDSTALQDAINQLFCQSYNFLNLNSAAEIEKIGRNGIFHNGMERQNKINNTFISMSPLIGVS